MLGPVDGTPGDDPIDRLIIQLRAYVQAGRRKSGARKARAWTSGITVIFDTETTTDPSQRLRFGAYQIRQHGLLLERGLFHADDVSAGDLASLRAYVSQLAPGDDAERIKLLTRTAFVEHAIFEWGLDVGGLIVGFNLPFDISRLATDHSYAKGSMKGGFSFALAEERPNIRVKHLSQRAAFISFAGKGAADRTPDRGFFVDVKTLAAALTGQSHSLESLTGLLGTTAKSPLDSYEGALTPEMIAYCLNDVQATWECFEKLADRYASFGLSRTGLHDLYSEASLGKAYLQAMGIKPWRQVHPDFPPELIGQIMSTYFGGRAEVHIRREITQVIHCDFLSMYPTVCTLMGLWRFVIAEGMTWRDATDEVRAFAERCDLDLLRHPASWRRLHCIVQVRPNGDVFPVRAQYEPDQPATIGVNRLTSRDPMWFTLADVLAAKLLGGKLPEIVSAIRFEPNAPQSDLSSIQLYGEDVQPERDDFYALLINQRRRVQALEEAAADDGSRATHNAAQQGLKILANSTSYGIFVELNVQQLDKSKVVTCYDHRGVGRKMTVSKVEEPGRYFHPLLGSLITGAARLMLAMAERGALDRGLGWAFCDTDSLAIANVAGLPREEFLARVESVRASFEPLNPYDVKGSILQLEKVNFDPGASKDPASARPVNCLAISAKRYVLFDRDEVGAPAIRKASRHGLGHLLAPYKDPDRKRIGRIGVQLWQEDLWREIICAHDRGRPDQPDFDRLPGLEQPAATRYAVTNQTLLAWFKGFNGHVDPADRVRPFNFLLTYQAKSRLEMAGRGAEELHLPAWNRRTPKPASRYSSDLLKDRPPVFDRDSGAPLPWEWLRSYRRVLNHHHLHSEHKFRGGDDAARGTLQRRHVEVWAAVPIGKEADNLDEREAFGEEDSEAWEMARQDRVSLLGELAELQRSYRISDRVLIERARVSRHTLNALRRGARVTQSSLLRIARAIEELRHEAEPTVCDRVSWRKFALQLRDDLGGRNKLARHLGVSAPYLGRVLSGEKPMTAEMVVRLASAGLVERR